jgi:multiple sugar transport system ATP-binding protein
MADIVFRNVTKRYGATVAVDNASLSINDNEFFCFFGPPLSGKSTILRLILGLEAPDAGEILIGGRIVNAVTPAERNVAMVFQNLALFPHMTARDNVRFPSRRAQAPRGRDRKARCGGLDQASHWPHSTSRLLSFRGASGSV